MDSTRGWTASMMTKQVQYGATYTAASGGTETTSGILKFIHSGDANFRSKFMVTLLAVVLMSLYGGSRWRSR